MKRPIYGSLEPYVPWRERVLPLNWDQEFGRQAALHIEIGFGNGDYLVRTASENPGENYVGIEVTWGSIWRSLRAANNENLENLRVLWEDARTALAWTFQEQTVDSVTALFPCPWPKRRHAKFRLFSPEFVSLCASRLKDDGHLTVVTDDPAYRDQMLETLTLANTGMAPSLEVIPASFGTKYERKWQSGGRQEFYRLRFDKREHHTIPTQELRPLKHYTIEHFHPESFVPQSEKEPHNVEFKNFLYDPKQQIAMQEVFVSEDGLDQHFWIRLRKVEDLWRILPAAGPNLLPIPGVQRALELVHQAAERSGE